MQSRILKFTAWTHPFLEKRERIKIDSLTLVVLGACCRLIVREINVVAARSDADTVTRAHHIASAREVLHARGQLMTCEKNKAKYSAATVGGLLLQGGRSPRTRHGHTVGRRDKASYRDARSHLKPDSSPDQSIKDKLHCTSLATIIWVNSRYS